MTITLSTVLTYARTELTDYLKDLEQKRVLKVTVWESQSLDDNPIEILWDKLDREMRKMPDFHHAFLGHTAGMECN